MSEPVSFGAVDEKLAPVMQLLHAHKPQLALDRILYLQRQGVFQPHEMWRFYERLALCYFQLLDMDKAQQAYWQSVTHPDGLPYRRQCAIYSDYLFTLHYLPHVSTAFLTQQHLAYNLLCPPREEQFLHPLPERRRAKIRVGYLAPFFIKNVVSFFSVQLMTRYDRSRFEVYLYSLWPQEDALTAELKQSVTGWTAFQPETDYREAAQRIHDDGIDILFDLTVHTEGGRTLQVMRYKPAPVQVAGIGYMSTSGMQAIDYFLTDAYLDPPGEHEEQFAERLLRLPHSHFCYTPPERFLQCKKTYQLHHPIVFGSFNNFAKITDDMLLLWKDILMRAPEARMLLKHSNRQSWIIRRVADRARRLGLPMERITLEGSTGDYLDRYMDVDIILDTYPYVGGGTTCDALLRGMPVITRYSERHGTRFGYSLLANIGLAELAAASDAEYVAKAVSLAQSPELLPMLHAQIEQRMRESPIMDGAGYVRDVEAAYQQIWQAWLKEQAGKDEDNIE